MHPTAALRINRLPAHLDRHYEIKDPSVVQIAPDQFMMFASVGNSKEQTWKVGRFTASSIFGEWQEQEPTIFHDLSGPQLCAPAVLYEEQNGHPLWSMYIQTACFEENGVIALATSTDGHNFYGHSQPLVTRETTEITQNPVIGVYDVGVSTVTQGTEELLCMLYSGYRRVGCGDIYMSTKKKNDVAWSMGKCLISQEDVPFHNRPDYEHFEWGLEGAKLVQFSESCFLMIGVCFMPLPHQFLGTRQRVFFAASDVIDGPYRPIGMPFIPKYDHTSGENGHPDILVIDGKVEIIYQEREGEGKPWYLRSASFDAVQLEAFLSRKLEQATTISLDTEIINYDSIADSRAFDHYTLSIN